MAQALLLDDDNDDCCRVCCFGVRVPPFPEPLCAQPSKRPPHRPYACCGAAAVRHFAKQ